MLPHANIPSTTASFIGLDHLIAYAMLPATVFALFAFYRSRGHKPERVSDEIEDIKPLRIIQFDSGNRVAAATQTPLRTAVQTSQTVPVPARPKTPITLEFKPLAAPGHDKQSAAMPIMALPPQPSAEPDTDPDRDCEPASEPPLKPLRRPGMASN